jgi:hypothetical protein
MRRFLACLLLSNLALLTGCTGPDDGGPGTEDAVLEIDTGTGGEGSGVTGTGGTEPETLGRPPAPVRNSDRYRSLSRGRSGSRKLSPFCRIGRCSGMPPKAREPCGSQGNQCPSPSASTR